MPLLENPKHEAFALSLARGLKQAEAYAQAGYTPNPPAASRLANSPAVKSRVEELKKEVHQRIVKAMDSPNEQNFESLAEMGLTMEWVAEQYKTIYQGSMEAGQFPAANTAVKSIQTLIEIENNGKSSDDVIAENKVDLDKVTDMLTAMKGVLEAAKEEETIVDMKDVTPDGDKMEIPIIPDFSTEDET